MSSAYVFFDGIFFHRSKYELLYCSRCNGICYLFEYSFGSSYICRTSIQIPRVFSSHLKILSKWVMLFLQYMGFSFCWRRHLWCWTKHAIPLNVFQLFLTARFRWERGRELESQHLVFYTISKSHTQHINIQWTIDSNNYYWWNLYLYYNRIPIDK